MTPLLGIPGAVAALFVFLAVGIFSAQSRRELLPLGLGALFLLVFTAFDPHPWLKDIDLNLLLTVPALAIFAVLLHRTGLSGFLAVKAVKLTQAQPLPLLFLTALGPFALAVFLGSGAALALSLPVTFFLAAELGIPVAPFLTSQILATNVGSLFSAVGSSAGLIVSSGLGLSYGTYLGVLWPYAVAVLLVSLALFPLFWGKAFRVSNERKARVLEYDTHLVLSEPVLLWRALTVLAGVTVLFVLSSVFSWGLALPAWLGAAALLLVAPSSAKPANGLATEVMTQARLPFLVGLVVFAEALKLCGVAGAVGQLWAHGSQGAGGAWLTLVLSGTLAAVTDPTPLLVAAVPTLKAAFASLALPSTKWASEPQALGLWLPLVLGSTLGSGALLGGLFSHTLARQAQQSKVELPRKQLVMPSLLVTGLQLATVGVLLPLLGQGR